MGFLKRLFGNQKSAEKSDKPYVDKNGIYVIVECNRCKSRMRLRADKQHDLNRTDGGLTWRKTFVCNKCFQKMPTVVIFDGNYAIVSEEIDGGRYLTPQQEAELIAQEEAEAARLAAEAEAEAAALEAAESADSAEQTNEGESDG